MGDNGPCNCDQALRLQLKLGQALDAILEARRERDAALYRNAQDQAALLDTETKLHAAQQAYDVCFAERQAAEKALNEKWTAPDMAAFWGEQGRQIERAEVVAWLRFMADNLEAEGEPGAANEHLDAADAIERGEHIPPAGGEQL